MGNSLQVVEGVDGDEGEKPLPLPLPTGSGGIVGASPTPGRSGWSGGRCAGSWRREASTSSPP